MKKTLVSEVIECTHYQGNEKQKFNKYRQLMLLYHKHKPIMKDIIMNLHKYASYKAYLYILSINKDDELESLIFCVLVNTLRDDIRKYAENKETSDLAKWLPRENYHFDKSLNFVNRYVLKLFPELFPQSMISDIDVQASLNTAKRRYRIILSNINRKLGTLEVLLSAKEKRINYENLSITQINKYFYKFLEEDNAIFTNFLKNKYLEMGICILDCIRDDKIKHTKEKEICNEVWDLVKFKHYNQFTHLFEKDSDLMIDITQDIYENGIISYMFCFVLMFIENNRDVYLNGNKIIINESDIFGKIQTIKQSIRLATNIKIPERVGNNKLLYVITTKDVKSIESFNSYDKIIICKPTFKKDILCQTNMFTNNYLMRLFNF
jgi:hypothetical protein